MKSLNILILSSKPMEWSANLGVDYAEALRKRGHHVDYNFPGMQHLIDVNRVSRQGKKQGYLYRLLRCLRLLPFFHKLGFFCRNERLSYIFRNGYSIINGLENDPLIDPSDILKGLSNKSYDIIITLFWENIISSYTLRSLYNHFRCPILINSIDMAPMTGGCYYFGSCRHFYSSNQCRKCPAVGGVLGSFTHSNYISKLNNYADIDVSFACNTYVSSFARKSGLFKKIKISSIIINNRFFHSIDRIVCLNRFRIPDNKSFIILFRYSSQKRKGYSYIREAILHLLCIIDKEERDKVLLLSVGEKFADDELLGEVDVLQLGHLQIEDLAFAYNCASVFINASIDDAGPSMVNQAIMCGTPVVSFESGVAQDVIIDGLSGFKVSLNDSISLGEKIHTIFRMKDDVYLTLRKSTLDVALQWNSGDRYVDLVEEICFSSKTE